MSEPDGSEKETLARRIEGIQRELKAISLRGCPFVEEADDGYAYKVAALCDALTITRAEYGEFVGIQNLFPTTASWVDSRTIALQLTDAVQREKTHELARLWVLLSSLFTADQKRRLWLTLPNPEFDQLTPGFLIKTGEIERVTHFLEQAAFGNIA